MNARPILALIGAAAMTLAGCSSSIGSAPALQPNTTASTSAALTSPPPAASGTLDLTDICTKVPLSIVQSFSQKEIPDDNAPTQCTPSDNAMGQSQPGADYVVDTDGSLITLLTITTSDPTFVNSLRGALGVSNVSVDGHAGIFIDSSSMLGPSLYLAVGDQYLNITFPVDNGFDSDFNEFATTVLAATAH